MQISGILISSLKTILLPLLSLFQTQCEGFCFILLYIVLCFCYLLEASFLLLIWFYCFIFFFGFFFFGFFICFFCNFLLLRDWKKLGLDGREDEDELRGVEKGRTVSRIYCMREESMFNKREQKESKIK